MKFRKKPVVIEAEQWFPGKSIDGVRITRDIHYIGPVKHGPPAEWAEIETLEGVMHISPGDWIITGVKGEKYPCRNDIFEATYEAI